MKNCVSIPWWLKLFMELLFLCIWIGQVLHINHHVRKITCVSRIVIWLLRILSLPLCVTFMFAAFMLIATSVKMTQSTKLPTVYVTKFVFLVQLLQSKQLASILCGHFQWYDFWFSKRLIFVWCANNVTLNVFSIWFFSVLRSRTWSKYRKIYYISLFCGRRFLLALRFISVALRKSIWCTSHRILAKLYA